MMVNRDGADDTPVLRGHSLNPGQLLAKILDSNGEERLKICTGMMAAAAQGNRCFDVDHEGTIKMLQSQLRHLIIADPELILRDALDSIVHTSWDDPKATPLQDIQFFAAELDFNSLRPPTLGTNNDDDSSNKD